MGEDRTLHAPAFERLSGAEVSCVKSLEKVRHERKALVGSAGSSALLMQVLASVAAGWTTVDGGAAVALSGAILPQLTNVNTSDLYFDEANAAFFSSSPHMGAAVGCLIAGMMMVVLGQRVVMLIVLPICLGCWLTIAFSSAILVVQVTRIIQGVCVGIQTVAPHAYVTEIADKRHRGTLDGITAFVQSMGIFLSFGLGAMSLNWRHVALVCGIVSTIPPFLGLLFFPNSPRWLASNGRYEEAEKALRFFRGQRRDITSEMEDIKTAVENNRSRSALKSQFVQLRDWTLLKLFLVLSFIIFAAELSGYMVMFSYALSIFESVAKGVNPTMCTLILGAFRSFTSVCYILVIERISRRRGLLISFLSSTVAMACMGTYFYPQLEMDSSEILTTFSFLPLVCTLVYIFFAFFGISLVLLLVLETLPLSFRALGSGVIDTFAYLSNFLVVQSFPYMNKTIKPYGTFWVYAGWCLVTAVASVTLLPETRGRTLEVIELSIKTKGGRKLSASRES